MLFTNCITNYYGGYDNNSDNYSKTLESSYSSKFKRLCNVMIDVASIECMFILKCCLERGISPWQLFHTSRKIQIACLDFIPG